MMFADDMVLCAMTREEVEEDLETRRVVFKKHGLKISRTKTEYLPSPKNDTETTVKSVDAELPTVTSFKYLGSLFTNEADVNNRIRSGWMKWNEVGPIRGIESHTNKPRNSAEMRMLRWGRGKTMLDHIRNEDTRKEVHVKPVEIVPTKLKKTKLVWPQLEARTQPHQILCEIAKTRGFWENEQRETEKRWSMEG